MKKRIRSAGVLALAAVSVLALTACGSIVIDSPQGQGTCGGNAFSLVTNQDTAGDNLTIEYTGPSSASTSLFWAQGLYFDSSVNGISNLVFGEKSTSYATKLDVTGAGWSTSGSGDSTHYSFSGTRQTLVNGQPTAFDLYNSSPLDGLLDSIAPVVVGVDCDPTHATGVVASSWAAANTLYPNSMIFDSLHVDSSVPISHGVRVTFSYPASALTAFGSFGPQVPVDLGISVDDPSISNDSLRNMWTQLVMITNSAVGSTKPVDNHDGTFSVEFTGSNSTDLPDGDFLLIGFVPNQDQSAGRVVFSTATYSVANGFEVHTVPFQAVVPAAVEPVPPAVIEPALAATGVNMSVVGASTVSGMGLLAAGILALALVRRRRARR